MRARRLNQEEISRYVVERLGRGASEDDVVLEVCQRTGLSWSAGETMVREIMLAGRESVSVRLAPSLLTLALPTLLAGTAMVLLSGWMILQTLKELGPLDGSTQVLAFVVFLLDTNLAPVILMILGLAMVIGSSIGIGQVIASLRREGN